MSAQKTFRCAIYTRKSHEEGLDQEFNSLQAQREACSAYIASQIGLGWKLNPAHYDDGGISGGHMDRPALQQLIVAIKKGLGDVIVVYKVDRLTRSLTDFAKLVDVFDEHNVSFVSVTQAFNTTSSMGRLTLNVLLSFAQFEREVTAERIRDKIAASKKKGMWMGGPPALGYINVDKKLVVEGDEARNVRKIFALYLKLKNVRFVQAELNRLGIKTKARIDKHGNRTGNRPFTRGHLYTLLKNPLYTGKLVHKDKVYEGRHDAIVDQKIWENVQSLLKANAVTRKNQKNARSPNPLLGLIQTADGNTLSTSHACKSGKRYRYYISRGLKQGDNNTGWRIPAEMIENLIKASLVKQFQNQKNLLNWIDTSPINAETLPNLFGHGCKLADAIKNKQLHELGDLYRLIIQSIIISKDNVLVKCKIAYLEELLEVSIKPAPTINIPIQIKRRGHEMKMIIGGANIDAKLIKLVAQAHALRLGLLDGSIESIIKFAAKINMHHADAKRLIPFGYLAPSIIEDILNGKQPADLPISRLRRVNVTTNPRKLRH
ncbi:MAG: recombinase family protein [Robiginitomaculum sp.]|nr:recombinase family protein [Robiginitomaculum sp.]